jgi:hypothetical protein
MYNLENSISNLELSHNILDKEMLSYTDPQMMLFLKHLCDQQLGIKNNIEFLVDSDMDVLPTVTGIICSTGQATVTIESTKSRIAMNPGDILIFPSEMNHDIDKLDSCRILKIGYLKNVDIESGSKQFIVTSTLIDKYQIKVYAENESEAIEKAKTTSISKWNHLDLSPEIKERKVIRYAKWHNFDAESID